MRLSFAFNETGRLGNEPGRCSVWYADGLRFTCTQCGNCCTGPPGYVWISKEEIVRLAEFLKITCEQTVEKYCRKVDGRFSLKESRSPEGLYDCIFLKAAEKGPGDDSTIASERKRCSVYPVRPLQCRTWPFWPENLELAADEGSTPAGAATASTKVIGPLHASKSNPYAMPPIGRHSRRRRNVNKLPVASCQLPVKFKRQMHSLTTATWQLATNFFH